MSTLQISTNVLYSLSRTESSDPLYSPHKHGWVSPQSAGSLRSPFQSFWVIPHSPPVTQILVGPRNSWLNTMRFPYNNNSVIFPSPQAPHWVRINPVNMIQYLILAGSGHIRTSTPTPAHLRMYNYTLPCSQKDFRYLCTCEIKLKLVLPFKISFPKIKLHEYLYYISIKKASTLSWDPFVQVHDEKLSYLYTEC